MNKLEAIRISKAINGLQNVRIYLNKIDAKKIDSMILDYESLLKIYQKKNLIITNVTNRELGSIRGSLKRKTIPIMVKMFKEIYDNKPNYEHIDNWDDNDVLYDNYCKWIDVENEWNNKFKRICDSTIIPDELINAKVLLLREQSETPYLFKKDSEIASKLKLQEQIKNTLSAEILNIFLEQKKEELLNLKLEYETSKQQIISSLSF